MQALEMLKEYKKKIDSELKVYFAEKIKEAKKVDSLGAEAIKIIRDFTMAGGKRIRPALVYYSYLAAGKEGSRLILKTSMSIELIHTFLLIHDDIIDRDSFRHGIPTVHECYRKIGKKIAPEKDVSHFGNSMAIVAGDMAASMANEIIFNAEFPPEIIIKALDALSKIVRVTIPGEMLDVVMEMKGEAGEDEILKMYEGKTSRYTFEGPLHLGAVLAEADSGMIEKFSEYAIPLGKAFQIRDDILGIFGKEKKLGKPIGSDIAEGKQTILVAHALKFGDNDNKRIISNLQGKKDLKKSELEAFQKAIIDSGSLEYSTNFCRKLVEESLEAAGQINFKNPEAEEFLKGIARYMISREV